MRRRREHDVTRLLREIAYGDHAGYEELLPLVYDELYRLAERQHRRLRGGDTLGPTALLNEAYLRLVGRADPGWNGRAHFYAVAARAMRQILIDYARRGLAVKRGGGHRRIVLDDVADLVPAGSGDAEPKAALLRLDAALAGLERLEPRLARVVECRFFADLSIPETAAALAVSPATVKRDWSLARAWLYRELTASD